MSHLSPSTPTRDSRTWSTALAFRHKLGHPMSGVARKLARIVGFVLPPIIVVVSFVRPSFSQTTVGTGSIVGIVSDPSGAVVIGAEITITDVATGQVVKLTANSSGTFNSGALVP